MQIMNNGFINGSDKPKRPEDLFYLDDDLAVEVKSPEEMKQHYQKVLKAWHLKN